MERDLERPSHKQKSEASPCVQVTDSEDAVPIEEDVKSPRSSNSLDKNCEIHLDGSSSSDLVQLDVNSAGANVVNNEAFCEPENGMEFETKEDAYSYYRQYARTMGFGITIKASRRSKKTGMFIDIKLVCSRFGRKRKSSTTVNPRPCIKTNCEAGMHMKRTQEGKWAICSVVKEHNHKICPGDFYYPTQGLVQPSATIVCQRKGLQLALDEGDVSVMLDYFLSMQAESPNFFYAVDIDYETSLRNVFWVDAKGRHDYKSFHDVVFFDTFFITNKYKVPFAPFVGINHHFQLILLGGALVGEESTSSMVWLMKTWLKAVGGQAPNVIISDQEDFLKEAIAGLLPNIQHCFSLWHVFSKLLDEVSCLKDLPDNFVKKFRECVLLPLKEEQFEERWWKMVDEFELRDNEWIQSLYEDRKKWVPTYLQGISLVGMTATERSGSIISLLDRHMRSDASLKEFIQQLRKFSEECYELEAKACLQIENRQLASRPLSAFEKQISSVYTDAVFKKLQAEILAMDACHLRQEREEREDKETVIFRVDDFAEHDKFFLAWNEAELQICCSCRSFEFKGFLCRHAMLLLQRSGVSNIPSCYILKRWTKDVKISYNCSEALSRPQFKEQRFNDLCRLALKLGEEGSASKEAYKIARQALEEVFRLCVDTNNSVTDVLEPSKSSLNGLQSNLEEEHGRKSSEKSKKNTNNKRQESVNTRAHNINYYVTEQDMQEMEQSNRAHNLDGYYGSRQRTEQRVQLHLMPTFVSHAKTHQNLPQQGQDGFRVPTMDYIKTQDSFNYTQGNS